MGIIIGRCYQFYGPLVCEAKAVFVAGLIVGLPIGSAKITWNAMPTKVVRFCGICVVAKIISSCIAALS